jgi:polysaccharide export outer membrane protein
MKNIYRVLILAILFASCSSKRNLVYLKDFKKDFETSVKNDYSATIQPNDVLNVQIFSDILEAAKPYNRVNAFNLTSERAFNFLGSVVSDDYILKVPILGPIIVKDLSLKQLEFLITKMLVDGGHLNDPIVEVRRTNSKFSVLGEVNRPGTYSYDDEKITIFQALAYAGDLTINANRKIKLVREDSKTREISEIDLTDSKICELSTYYVHNNDVIIVDPNYSKVKSSGFIGSPASISSIASILLSITLLLTNN